MAKHDPDLSLLFQALSDPTRRSILSRLMEGPAPVSVLAEPTGMALPTVLRHLSVLEDARLIETEKTGRTRLCRARPTALQAATAWLDDQRRIWEARTDRLEALLETLQDKGEADEDRPGT
ncbi:metalloregulator ArsR/SmtB family transcription factor [Tabrizicola sp. J26]|uniref:ArsR/SmtB family transcription factor n=1 Tax=Alitabrizicola rongguiensis TaxID=2909234 RepID=UPI001F2BFD0B|nr:metalloregulator ArsR/SmtB family transcription factor [Tabrizicola rongguiensis]MCF1707234.1 metalloregulator ArsR/SmtB family transcription factor [Tabrizicola rongguiensis]